MRASKSKVMVTMLYLLALLLVALPVGTGAAAASGSEPASVPGGVLEPLGFEQDTGLFFPAAGDCPGVIDTTRARAVEINLDALGGKDGPGGGEEPAGHTVNLNLFPAEEPTVRLTAALDRVQSDRAGYTWQGHVIGQPDSWVQLSVSRREKAAGGPDAGPALTLVGDISAREGTFRVTPAGGHHCIEETDQARLMFNQRDYERDVVPDAAAGPLAPAAADDGSILDVLVIYTTDAKTAAGGQSQIEQIAQQTVALGNQSHANSGVEHRLWLVDAVEVPGFQRRSCSGEEFLFDTDSDYSSNLDAGTIPQALKNEFQAKKGITISGSAYVLGSDPDWRIYDGCWTYILANDSGFQKVSNDSCHRTDLCEFRTPGDGVLDTVHVLRDALHADVTFLIVRDSSSIDPYSTSGVANVSVQGPPVTAYQHLAFGLGTLGCSRGLCFSHEVGHIRGLSHDWYTGTSAQPYPWGNGHTNTTGKFGTVMSYYWTLCGAKGVTGCVWIPNFSNPDVSVSGVPTGIASTGPTNCVAGSLTPDPETCAADSRLALNTTDAMVAGYRASEWKWAGSVDGNWDNPANWQFQAGAAKTPTPAATAPRAIDDVFVPGALASGNWPTISAGTTANARELIIGDGAELNMTGGALNVYYDWEEQGTGQFNGSGGTVVFKGPLPQTVTMGASSSLSNVQIGDGGSAEVTFAASGDINGHLTIKSLAKLTLNSNLDLEGDLTIESGATLDGNTTGNTIRVAGNWDDQGLSFVPGNSHVIFDGTSQTIDKVTSETLLSENFDQFTTCCTTQLPAGWASDAIFAQGPLLDADPSASRWRNQTDGYLFTSPLDLKPGTNYELAYAVATRQNYTDGDGMLSPQTVSVILSTAQNSASQVQVITASAVETSTTRQTRTASFSVTTAGTYYLGFRAQQTGDDYCVFDDIVLEGEGPAEFYDLTVESGTATFNQDVAVLNNLTINSGATMNVDTHKLGSVGGTFTNDGTLSNNETDTVAADDQPLMCRDARRAPSAEVTAPSGSTAPGDTTVETNIGSTIPANGAAGNCLAFGNSVKRYYGLTGSTSTGLNVTLRLYYDDAELNGNAEGGLQIMHCESGQWVPEAGTHTRNDVENWVEVTGVDSFSAFTLAQDDPTALTLSSFRASARKTVALPLLVAASTLVVSATLALWSRRRLSSE